MLISTTTMKVKILQLSFCYVNHGVPCSSMPKLYLHKIIIQDIAIFMFNVKNKLLPKSVLDLFTTTSNNYNLRNADFTLPKVNTTRFGKHFLQYFGPFLYGLS